jgi:hypothetical protein
VSAKERAAEMERGGPSVGLEDTPAAIRGQEVEPGLRREQVADGKGLEEVCEIGAAAHADVLAGIDELAGVRVCKRTGAAAEAMTRLQDRHAEAALRQGGRGGQSGQSASDDGDSIQATFSTTARPAETQSRYPFICQNVVL